MESKFALDQPPVDPMQEFEDECLQSFGYTVDLVAFDDFDDNGTLVDNAAGNADAGTNHNRRLCSANAYPFEFGDFLQKIPSPKWSRANLPSFIKGLLQRF